MAEFSNIRVNGCDQDVHPFPDQVLQDTGPASDRRDPLVSVWRRDPITDGSFRIPMENFNSYPHSINAFQPFPFFWV